jgi:hypothetical protein
MTRLTASKSVRMVVTKNALLDRKLLYRSAFFVTGHLITSIQDTREADELGLPRLQCLIL